MTTYDNRMAEVKKAVTHYEGAIPYNADKNESKNGLLSPAQIKANLLNDMKESVRYMDSLRNGGVSNAPANVTLEDFAKDKLGFGSIDSFLSALDINPASATIDSFVTSSDFNEGYRWLVPEIIRESVRLGLRKNPIYENLIYQDVTVSQKKVTLPQINMSDATPEIVRETETIPVGSVSFGEKDIKLKKMGTGLKISDDVQKYVPLNILSMYLQDAGIQLGLGLDTWAIDVLINGDDNTGKTSAPVIGVKDTSKGITYYDLLRAMLRMGRIGRTPTGILSNEDAALDVLMLDEFRNTQFREVPTTLKLKSPVPQSLDYLLHGAMPSGSKLILFDKESALLKLTAESLKVESERIAERQLNGTYITVVTGFAKLFRDASLIVDGTQSFSKFPDYMDLGAAENVIIK